MARYRTPGVALALLCAANLGGATAFAQDVTYTDSSTAEKLQSKVGVGIEEDGFSVRADMLMVGQDGRTQVLPRVSSAWSRLDILDISTVLSYQDWNGSADPFEPSIDTRLLLKSRFAFVDAIEGKVHSAGASSEESLKVTFTDLNTGVEIFGGNPLGLQADLLLRDAGAGSRTTSNLSSSWGVGKSLEVKTVLRFDAGATATFSTPAMDTSLVYRAPVPFIRSLEGELQRSVSGDVRQSLGVRFPEIAGGDTYGTSFEISSRAVVEEMLRADGHKTLSMGVETRFKGFMPPLVGGSNSLSFRVDRRLDELEAETSSFAYDHSWSPGDASIGLNLKLLRRPDEVEPSMGVTWTTQF